MKHPIEGKKYLKRYNHFSGSPDLHKVKLLKIVKLGDGTEIARYSYNWPFTIVEDMELAEFIKHIEVSTNKD